MGEIRAIIIKDEHNSINLLGNLFEEFCPSIQVIGKSSFIPESVEILTHSVKLESLKRFSSQMTAQKRNIKSNYGFNFIEPNELNCIQSKGLYGNRFVLVVEELSELRIQHQNKINTL